MDTRLGEDGYKTQGGWILNLQRTDTKNGEDGYYLEEGGYQT